MYTGNITKGLSRPQKQSRFIVNPSISTAFVAAHPWR